MPLPANLLQQMLQAAEGAAGAQWGVFAGDMKAFLQNALDDAKQTAEDFASGAITQDQAKVEVDSIMDEAGMLGNYAEESVKLAAQTAINAASKVLWAAILAL